MGLDGLQFLALGLLLYPHLPQVLPFLAIIGLLSVSAFGVGYLLFGAAQPQRQQCKIPFIPPEASTRLLYTHHTLRTGNGEEELKGETSWEAGVTVDPGNQLPRTLEDSVALTLRETIRAQFTKPLSSIFERRPSSKDLQGRAFNLQRIEGDSATVQEESPASDLSHALSTSQSIEQRIVDTVIDPNVQRLSSTFVAWYQNHRQLHIDNRIYAQALSIVHDHIRQYKKARRDVLREHAVARSSKRSSISLKSPPVTGDDSHQRHLDEFNEQDGWGDGAHQETGGNSSLRHHTEELNSLIVERLKASGELHPAASKGSEEEMAWLRSLVQKLWEEVDSMLSSGRPKGTDWAKSESKGAFRTPSRLMKLLLREWVVCRVLQPALDLICHPAWINRQIYQKARRSLLAHKAIKSYRSTLESHFSDFPPAFMQPAISNPSNRFSISQKWRYLEALGPYAKKARSTIDAQAVRFQITAEIRRMVEAGKNSTESSESVRRYIKALKILRGKFDKRIAILTGMHGARASDSPRKKSDPAIAPSAGTGDVAALTLRMLLDEYMELDEANAGLCGLWYFIDYLEKQHDGGIAKVRFWLSSEGYRKLVGRLCNNGTGNEGEIVGVKERLRKEATKIYNTFLAPSEDDAPLVDLGNDIVTGAIREFLTTDSTSDVDSGDHRCVLIAQETVFKNLEIDFKEFVHSESYFRWRSEVEKSKLTDLRHGIPSDSFDPHIPYRSGPNVWDFADASGDIKKGTVILLLDRDLEAAADRLNGSPSPEAEHQKGQSPSKKNTGKMESQNDHSVDLTMTLSDSGVMPDGTPAPTEKHEPADEEPDIHAPGELLFNTTKVQELQESLDSVLAQLNCLNLLAERALSVASTSNEIASGRAFILDQTREILRQEIGDLTKAKAKFESKEQKDAIVPGQCIVKIEAAVDDVVAKSMEEPGKRVTFYLVQVSRDLESGWTVRRRYSDFDALHRKLSKAFPAVNEYDLPGKVLGFLKGRHELKQARMKSLERYLQAIWRIVGKINRLVDNPEIARSDELRAFLSSSNDSFRHALSPAAFGGAKEEGTTLQRTSQRLAKFIAPSSRTASSSLLITPSKDTRIFSESTGNLLLQEDTSMQSTKGIERIGQESRNRSATDVGKDLDYDHDESEDDEIDKSWEYPTEEGRNVGQGTNDIPAHVSLLGEPLCFLLMEVYEFREQNPWLRRSAAAMLIKQSLGGRDSLDSQLSAMLRDTSSDESIIGWLSAFRKRLRSAGESGQGPVFQALFEKVSHQAEEDAAATRGEAKEKLISVWPAAFARVLGAEASVQGTSRLFDLLQNATLNKHLAYSLLDGLITTMLGDA
ncbi:hypothetical protein SpCBS45565_g06233 [Spizellomyces sp. 'palustris']|nr:hypothetical protein SpCBS45565_g06233 [Spizellomyces sp. 'palustris']